MQAQYQTALVAFHTHQWIRVAAGSFHQHFPEARLLVVDNNPKSGEPGFEERCAIESAWLCKQSYITVLPNPSPKKSHGIGLDIAAAWCRDNAVPIMVLIEPDCLIRGRQWLERLVASIQTGSQMSGYFSKSYGPIHPAPSAWDVGALKFSFETSSRVEDERHPRFPALFNVEELRRIVALDGDSWEFWGYYWDSTQKNWFEAAIRDKASLLPIGEELDFRHYWCGSTQNRDHAILRTDAELRTYLSDSSS